MTGEAAKDILNNSVLSQTPPALKRLLSPYTELITLWASARKATGTSVSPGSDNGLWATLHTVVFVVLNYPNKKSPCSAM